MKGKAQLLNKFECLRNFWIHTVDGSGQGRSGELREPKLDWQPKITFMALVVDGVQLIGGSRPGVAKTGPDGQFDQGHGEDIIGCNLRLE